MFTLRNYQDNAVKMVDQHWNEGVRRVMLCAPTGAGKCLAQGTPVLLHDGRITSG